MMQGPEKGRCISTDSVVLSSGAVPEGRGARRRRTFAPLTGLFPASDDTACTPSCSHEAEELREPELPGYGKARSLQRDSDAPFSTENPGNNKRLGCMVRHIRGNGVMANARHAPHERNPSPWIPVGSDPHGAAASRHVSFEEDTPSTPESLPENLFQKTRPQTPSGWPDQTMQRRKTNATSKRLHDRL